MLERKSAKIRLMTEADLPLVLEWRNAEHIRANMFNDSPIGIDEHFAWFRRESMNEQTRLLIYEYGNNPLGVVNFYNISCPHQRCFWGFYIGAPVAPPRSGLAMGILALDFIFEELPLNKVCSDILTDNAVSIAYHRRLGFVEEGVLRQHIRKQEAFHDVLQMALFKDSWHEGIRQLNQNCFGENEL